MIISEDKTKHLTLYDIEAEQELLGFLILNNNNIDLIANLIIVEHFYDETHRAIFKKFLELTDKNHQANEKTLFYELENQNPFDKKEKLKEYLEFLVNSTVGSLYDIKSLIKIINELYLKRSLNEIRHNIGSYITNNNNIIQVIEKIESEVYNIRNVNVKSEVQSLRDINKVVLEKFKKARDSQKDILGLKTNLKDFDTHLGGLNKSDLIIIAARPSMGKSALAINIATNIAKNCLKNQNNEEAESENGGIAFFSLEMSSEQVASRIVAMESYFSTKSIYTGRKDNEKTNEKNIKLNDDEFHAVVKTILDVQKLGIYIDDTPSLSLSSFKAKARLLKRKFNIKAIFVDYLQLMTTSKTTFNRVQEIAEITQGLKAVAKEFDIPVIALSQLSRAVEMTGRSDKKPKLSDLRESGSIEQDADIVTFLYREAYYLEREINFNERENIDKTYNDQEEPDNQRKKNFNERENIDKTYNDQEEPDNQRKKKLIEKLDKCKNIATIIVAKNRNGPIGEIDLYFNENYMKFDNLSKDFVDKNQKSTFKSIKKESTANATEEWYNNINIMEE